MRLRGEVVRFEGRGFGFVVGEDRKSYFLHFKNVTNALWPKPGDSVTFEVAESGQPGKGLQAVNAVVIPALAEKGSEGSAQ